MARRFIFELIDVPYLAVPSLGEMDLLATAKKIQQYRRGGSPRNYDPAVRLIQDCVSGLTTRERVTGAFDEVADEVWKKQLEDVSGRLFDIFGAKQARWYPTGRKPIELFDRAWFKPAIRGVWYIDGAAYATLINARKTLFLSALGRAFVGRGVIEFHVIDDPNIAAYKVVDLGADPNSGGRATRLYSASEIDPMSIEEFEGILRRFMRAVEIAGYSSQPSEGMRIVDLFRRPRG
jgi:hypothetical protein